MPEPRRRGRPALAPGVRKVSRGLRLSPQAWGRLAEIAAETGETQAAIVERLILEE
jgi:predicted DNA-binding protein